MDVAVGARVDLEVGIVFAPPTSVRLTLELAVGPTPADGLEVAAST